MLKRRHIIIHEHSPAELYYLSTVLTEASKSILTEWRSWRSSEQAAGSFKQEGF